MGGSASGIATSLSTLGRTARLSDVELGREQASAPKLRQRPVSNSYNYIRCTYEPETYDARSLSGGEAAACVLALFQKVMEE